MSGTLEDLALQVEVLISKNKAALEEVEPVSDVDHRAKVDEELKELFGGE